MKYRVLFCYNADWDKEVVDFQRGVVPSHRLFGFSDIQALGHYSLLCRAPRRLRKLLSKSLVWRCYQAVWTLGRQSQIDCIVATHEACALPLLLLKRLRLLKTPVVVINVALLHPKNCAGFRGLFWRRLLPLAEAILSYASAQSQWLNDEFDLDPKRLFFAPLGVDTNFFAPTIAEHNCSSHKESFSLSVGTNEGKDYATLVKALPSSVKLIIVTDAYNAQIIEDTKNLLALSQQASIQVLHDIPIEQLKTYYQTAQVQIIPLLETRFSSGQTVLLENMALGKVVIVTKVAATQDYVEDNLTAITVEPGDVKQLRARIDQYLAHPQQFEHIGVHAAAMVRRKFSSQVFAYNLIDIIRGAIRTSYDRRHFII